MAARLRYVFLLLLSFCLTGLSLAQQPNVPSGSRFVMSHFKSDGGGGDERLFISVSPDGLNWTALNSGNPVWQPDGWHGWGNVVRDPSIIYDNGFYWVAYTSGNYGRHQSFGLTKSRDLLNWTYVGKANVPIPGATDQLTWNPVFFRDSDGSVHVFINISPSGGTKYDPAGTMKTYETHPLDPEWTQWSTPVLVSLPGNNSNEFFVWKEGSTYHGVYVDFSRTSLLVKVSSQHLTSGWGNEIVINTRGEGCMILKHPGGSGYRLYTESGNGNGTVITTYKVADLNPTFSNAPVFQSVQSSIGMRNGKMTALVGTTSYAAWQTQNLPGQPADKQSATADPDADGLPNLLEAASALNPLSPTRAGHPILGFAPLRMTYRRAPWLVATLTPEASNDLLTWDQAGLQTESVTLQTDGTEEVHLLDTASNTPSRFVRLRATLPETVQTASLMEVSESTVKKKTRRSSPIRKFQRW